MVAPSMAVRADKCWVCTSVAYVEDVNVRLFDADMQPLREWAPAVSYLRSIGLSGSSETLASRLKRHQRHVDAYIHGAPVAPVSAPRAIVKVNDTPAEWLDVNQQAINMGLEALRGLSSRLQAGELDVHEEMEIAKIGLSAAHKRGDLVSRGRMLRQERDELLGLVSGLGDDPS